MQFHNRAQPQEGSGIYWPQKTVRVILIWLLPRHATVTDLISVKAALAAAMAKLATRNERIDIRPCTNAANARWRRRVEGHAVAMDSRQQYALMCVDHGVQGKVLRWSYVPLTWVRVYSIKELKTLSCI